MTDDAGGSGTPWGSVPSNADMALTRLEQARAFLRAQSADAALREAEAALSLSGTDAIAYAALDVIGDAYWLKDDALSTLDIGERMVGMNPHAVDGYIHVARAALSIRHFPKAHAAIAAGLREHPEHVGLLILMGQRHLAVGHPHGALAPAHRAAELAPTNPYVLQNLAMVLRASGKNRQAQDILKQVYELDPTSGSTFAMSAYDAFAQHRFVDAIPLAQKALEGDPENELARYVLARSRVYRHPLMRPYWFLARQNTALVCVVALVAMVAMGYAGRGIGGMLIGAIFIYALLCMMVALWVDRDRGPEADKPPKVTLKDY